MLCLNNSLVATDPSLVSLCFPYSFRQNRHEYVNSTRSFVTCYFAYSSTFCSESRDRFKWSCNMKFQKQHRINYIYFQENRSPVAVKIFQSICCFLDTSSSLPRSVWHCVTRKALSNTLSSSLVMQAYSHRSRPCPNQVSWSCETRRFVSFATETDRFVLHKISKCI